MDPALQQTIALITQAIELVEQAQALSNDNVVSTALTQARIYLRAAESIGETTQEGVERSFATLNQANVPDEGLEVVESSNEGQSSSDDDHDSNVYHPDDLEYDYPTQNI